jgi:ATP-dependent Clp protease ATP-binding subunit ClpA
MCCLKVLSRWTGIPVAAIDQEEREKLLHLAEKLHERVVGQDEAVNLVAQAMLRSRVGLDQPGQPIGSFLFLGSTGVGKTELAKSLAMQLFDSEKVLVRFDMSEYSEHGDVMRLIGAPPRFNLYIVCPFYFSSSYLVFSLTGVNVCFTAILVMKMVGN